MKSARPVPIQTLKTIVVVHGKSEYHVCKHISSNLHQNQYIVSRDKGGHSIQIPGLVEFLKRHHHLKSLTSLRKDYNVECHKKELTNCKIFIIMDTDDCTSAECKRFKEGSLFQGLWLANHIVPIYNSPNLEATMLQAGYKPVERKKDYLKYFPMNNGKSLDMETIETLHDKLQDSRCSNLHEYVQHCIAIAKANLKD